jgi:hypothetical protein
VAFDRAEVTFGHFTDRYDGRRVEMDAEASGLGVRERRGDDNPGEQDLCRDDQAQRLPLAS